MQGQVNAAAAEGMKQTPIYEACSRPASELVILPGLTHYNIFADPAVAAVAIPFLDKPVESVR